MPNERGAVFVFPPSFRNAPPLLGGVRSGRERGMAKTMVVVFVLPTTREVMVSEFVRPCKDMTSARRALNGNFFCFSAVQLGCFQLYINGAGEGRRS